MPCSWSGDHHLSPSAAYRSNLGRGRNDRVLSASGGRTEHDALQRLPALSPPPQPPPPPPAPEGAKNGVGGGAKNRVFARGAARVRGPRPVPARQRALRL